MNRRRFLQTIGALAATPAVAPLMPAFAGTGATAIPAGTYKWAEVIVRAHKTCTPAMLQRTLSVSPAVAEAVQSKLIANGVLGAQANAWGMHQAVNPLFDGLFRQADVVTNKTWDVAKKLAKRVREEVEEAKDEILTGHENRADLPLSDSCEEEPRTEEHAIPAVQSNSCHLCLGGSPAQTR